MRAMLQAAAIAMTALTAMSLPAAAQGPIPALDEQTIRDAYVYLLGRAIVVRQEQADIAEAGIDYNVVKYNPVGRPLGWVNPNLDVANTEAWIAVDDRIPALLEIPKIEGRYYTVEIIDEWGEVITNINDRSYPLHPHGRYAFVAPGSTVPIPEDAVRIELRSPKAKMLARIEIRNDPEGAVALQRQITLHSLGKPEIAPAIALPAFDNASLIGVELFDHAAALLASAPDVSPVAAEMQSRVRDIAKAVAEPGQRAAIDSLLRDKVIPEFQRYAVAGAGAKGNGWIGTTTIGNYGEDYAIRTAANYVGIWANARHEVIYFVTTTDADGNALDGSKRYVIHFSMTGLPDGVVNAYWSLSMVDVPDFLAVPNPIDRYTFNGVAPPPLEADGSMKIFLAPRPGPALPDANWLPSPEGKPFSLTFRTYVPKSIVKDGAWFPPAVRRLD